MRAALAFLLFSAACATTVRDLPTGAAPREGEALVAGRLAFDGSPIGRSLSLVAADGRIVALRPEREEFLAALPAGPYTVRRFGAHTPAHDKLTLEARPGAAVYLGSFVAARTGEGDLVVVVRDERARVEQALRERYGAATPRLESGLVRSSLPPAPGAGPELTVAVAPPEPPSLGFGFGFGFSSFWRHHRGYCAPRR
ncbi:MAG: hypothetical protein ACT4PV_02290 [Planctomycetaceae bacterium]